MEWTVDVNYDEGAIILRKEKIWFTWAFTPEDILQNQQLIKAFNKIAKELNDLELEVSIQSEAHHGEI